MQPEKKSVVLMNDVVHKYSKRSQMVLDAFTGTLSAAKACILVDKHRPMVGGEKDVDCL